MPPFFINKRVLAFLVEYRNTKGCVVMIVQVSTARTIIRESLQILFEKSLFDSTEKDCNTKIMLPTYLSIKDSWEIEVLTLKFALFSVHDIKEMKRICHAHGDPAISGILIDYFYGQDSLLNDLDDDWWIALPDSQVDILKAVLTKDQPLGEVIYWLSPSPDD